MPIWTRSDRRKKGGEGAMKGGDGGEKAGRVWNGEENEVNE